MTTTRGIHHARAFTLVELLTVIAIIVVLISISVGVGVYVTKGGERRATQNVLGSLDRALEEYVGVNGTIPPYLPQQYEGVPGPDATLTTYRSEQHARRPDASVFIGQARGVGAVGDVIANLPARFRFARSDTYAGGGVQDVSQQVPSIIDAWGEDNWSDPWVATEQQLVYYVHPDNYLAQDLYGQCLNKLPYFMSAGQDLLYGLNDDKFIPADDDGNAPATHTYQTLLAAQKDNLTSYPVEPVSRSAFERTQSAGVR